MPPLRRGAPSRSPDPTAASASQTRPYRSSGEPRRPHRRPRRALLGYSPASPLCSAALPVQLDGIYSIMVTASVTYLGGSEERLVAHREVVRVAHKGSDQAPLYGRRAGRGVRGVKAHDAQGSRGAFGDGSAFALHAGSGGRVLPAAGRQETLAFFDRGRGARADRLLRSPAQVSGAPLLHPKPLCGDQAAGRLAQGRRSTARQYEEARLRGRAGARLRGPALG